MTPSKEVAKQQSSAVAGVDQSVLDELRKQQESEITSDLIKTPILKLAQQMTKEVANEDNDISMGDFFNSLTGETYGTAIQFIPVYFQTGRFAVDRKNNRSYPAFGKLIPDSWADLVGEEYVGTPFENHPDAEEVYKTRVNRKEIPWGNGPLISTTYNFTGYVVLENEDGEVGYEPARYSAQRSQVNSAKRWLTLARAKRNSMLFDFVYTLGRTLETFNSGSS